jgi:hypothetical protein
MTDDDKYNEYEKNGKEIEVILRSYPDIEEVFLEHNKLTGELSNLEADIKKTIDKRDLASDTQQRAKQQALLDYLREDQKALREKL